MTTLPREPQVENRYHLTISDIQKLKVGNHSLIHWPLFRWDSYLSAWCISDSCGDSMNQIRFHIEIYSENAPQHSGEFIFYFTRKNEENWYEFKRFFNPNDIENINYLVIQELFLAKINELLDKGILVQP